MNLLSGFGWSVLGLIVLVASSVMVAVFREISWHELKEYSKRRGRRDRFDALFENHDSAVLALETLRAMGIVGLLIGAHVWTQAAWPATNPDAIAAPVSDAWWWLSLGSGVLLVLGVWLPMGIAQFGGEPLVFHLWPLMRILRFVLFPLTVGAWAIALAIQRMSGQTAATEEEAFEEEVLAIVTEGLHDGHLEADAREMIEGVIELGDGDVADIMTPRSKMDVVPLEWDWERVLAFVTTCGRTRIPVYRESADDIVGILYVKDLLAELSGHAGVPRRPLAEMLREPWYVPPTQRLDGLLHDFRQTRNHLAIVRDEFERVAGLVTIEDVLEEIVGEIVDETDKEEQVEEIRRVDARTAVIQGRTHLADVNETLGLELPEPNDFDTIAGFVISRLGHIPAAGEQVVDRDMVITVLQANRRKVESVRLEMLHREVLSPSDP